MAHDGSQYEETGSYSSQMARRIWGGKLTDEINNEEIRRRTDQYRLKDASGRGDYDGLVTWNTCKISEAGSRTNNWRIQTRKLKATNELGRYEGLTEECLTLGRGGTAVKWPRLCRSMCRTAIIIIIIIILFPIMLNCISPVLQVIRSVKKMCL